ncbi:MAG: PHP domain-containing protein [Promethearchaeota archaeon]
MSSIKLDLHLHTVYSGDSLIKPSDLINISLKKGLNGFAITDHATLKAYNLIKKIAINKNLIVIPGMEIETHMGEVIALFLNDEIDLKDNNFFNVVEQIKEQNGLVLIPHPFDFLRPNHLKLDLISDEIIKKYLDGIEIINSRIIFKNCVKKAKKFNKTHDLFETGGSDAHTLKEIGNGYTLINDPTDLSLESIYECLKSRKSKSGGQLSSPLVHAITILNKFQKGLYFFNK